MNVVRFERPAAPDLRDSLRRSLDLMDVGAEIGFAAVALAACAQSLTFAATTNSKPIPEAISGAKRAATDVLAAIAALHRAEDR